MTQKPFILAIVALAAAISAAGASAQGKGGKGKPGDADACENVVIRLSQPSSMVYDPGDEARRVVEVDLTNDSPAQSLDCDLESVVLAQTTPQPLAFVGDGDLLNTQQVRDPMIAYRQQNFELSQSALRALESGAPLHFGLVEPNTNQFVPPGRYVLPFTVAVNGAAVTSTELVIEVIPRVLAFGKSRKVTTLDFGELETGETRKSNVMVKTNAQLRVHAVSDNGGELKHETLPGAPGVPYTAYLDGELLNLNSGASQEVEDGPGNGVPHISRLLVRIGEVDVPWAGVYKDVLTLHFTAY